MPSGFNSFQFGRLQGLASDSRQFLHQWGDYPELTCGQGDAAVLQLLRIFTPGTLWLNAQPKDPKKHRKEKAGCSVMSAVAFRFGQGSARPCHSKFGCLPHVQRSPNKLSTSPSLLGMPFCSCYATLSEIVRVFGLFKLWIAANILDQNFALHFCWRPC